MFEKLQSPVPQRQTRTKTRAQQGTNDEVYIFTFRVSLLYLPKKLIEFERLTIMFLQQIYVFIFRMDHRNHPEGLLPLNNRSRCEPIQPPDIIQPISIQITHCLPNRKVSMTFERKIRRWLTKRKRNAMTNFGKLNYSARHKKKNEWRNTENRFR